MHKVTVLFFGQITDITGTHRLVLENATDTDSLLVQLKQLFPALQPQHYRIAVNKEFLNSNIELTAGTEIALLPPFSGG